MDIQLKKSELAKALSLSRAAIDKAIKSKHLYQSENKLVDFSIEKNDLWLKGQVAKGRKFDLNNIYVKPEKKVKKVIKEPSEKKDEAE